MTTPLVDPSQTAFWASDPSLLKTPDFLGAPGFLDGPAPAPEPVETETHHVRLALELAAAFLVCARLVRNHLILKEPTSNGGPADIARSAWAGVMPVWKNLAGAALRRSLTGNPAVSVVDDVVIVKIATDYISSVGNYLGTLSISSFLDGIDRQLAQRWSSAVAYTRSSAGFGMDRGGYGAFLTTAAKSEGPELVSPAAQHLAEQSLVKRAQRIGEAEAHTAGQAIKTLLWAQMQQVGKLPLGAQRVWLTHNDEHDCQVCGPLNHVRAFLDNPFVIGELSFWSPQAHPNCRCRMELIVPIVKSDFDPKKHPRAQAGRFGRVQPKPVTDAPVRDPAIDEMMAQARALTVEEDTQPVEAEQAGFSPGFAPGFSAGFSPAFSPARFAAAAAFSPGFGKPGAGFSASQPGFGRRKPAPKLRVTTETVILPPAPPPARGPAYYLPTVELHRQIGEEPTVMLGLHTPADFNFRRPVTQSPLAAAAQPSPWAVGYYGRAIGRVDTKTVLISHGDGHVTAGVRDVVDQDYVHAFWTGILVNDLNTGFSQAIANVEDPRGVEHGLVQDLDIDDRDAIAELAGYTDYNGDFELRGKIAYAAQHLDLPHAPGVTPEQAEAYDSLAQAYGDYMIYQRPDLLGTVGERIRSFLNDADADGIHLSERPADQVMEFRQGFQPDTTADEQWAHLTGQYYVSKLRYHSAIHEFGTDAKPLQMGLQVASMAPIPRLGEEFRHPKDFQGFLNHNSQ